jgi:hypothetical protein
VDGRFENLAAQLTLAAYRVALGHGAASMWVAVELSLWRSLTETVKKWTRDGIPNETADELESWRQSFLIDLTAVAVRIIQKYAANGFPLEVESDLSGALRAVIGIRKSVR